MIVKELKPEQWNRLKEIFEREFDSDLPKPENSRILACFEDGKMVGFVLAEQVLMIGQIYVVPPRREKSGEIVRSLLSYIREKIAPRNVVGAVASEKRFEALYRAFGMQKIEGKFYRKNF